MRKEAIATLYREFEERALKRNNDLYWSARDLQALLGYENWVPFMRAIEKAKQACKALEIEASDHFFSMKDPQPKDEKGLREGAPFQELMLSQYACYLVSQAADSRREEVTFAFAYFIYRNEGVKTVEKKTAELERLRAREKLAVSEKRLSGILKEKGISELGFARIRSKGDEILFGGFDTAEMKVRLKMPKERPLADYLPTVTIRAKDYANEATYLKIEKFGYATEQAITAGHLHHNEEIRQSLADRKIRPEYLPAEEDVEKVERRLRLEAKRFLRKGRRKKLCV